ncbi:MAG: hypothetical protein AB7V04_00860 [Desulfomonilaceae bacterium]
MQSVSQECGHKKPQCLDCRMCLGCSESRCVSCRGKNINKNKKKLNFEQQIALWESINKVVQVDR